MTTRAEPRGPGNTSEPGSWTVKVRDGIVGLVPEGQALPDRQPVYVHSWIYVFGVATLAALAVVIVTGGILAIGGVAWWHVSSLGLFVNSLHLWSVELFFGFMVIHLWGKFWMAAWRGKLGLTWATCVICFLASLATAFTGYTITTNFNAQWIAFEAKDVMNAVALGSWINVTNLGQMVLIHVCMLPLAIVAVVAMHVLLVRKHGVVPPIDAIDPEADLTVASAPSHSSDSGSADASSTGATSGAVSS
jgi:ubiquinol-cytochrome c reductase cytochrome b subunit